MEDECPPTESNKLFGTAVGLMSYFAWLHLTMALVQWAFVEGWFWAAAAFAALLLLIVLGRSFRHLWRKTDWFKVGVVGQAIIQLGFMCASFLLDRKSLSGLGIPVALICFAILMPAQTNFCRKNGVPLED